MDTELADRLAYEELSDDELEVLIGLMLQLAEADEQVSPEEAAQLKNIAQEVGRERFLARANNARERFDSLAAIFESAAKIEDGKVHRTIFQAVRDLALGDGIVRQEAAFLDRLSDLWQVDWSS